MTLAAGRRIDKCIHHHFTLTLEFHVFSEKIDKQTKNYSITYTHTYTEKESRKNGKVTDH